MKQYRQGDIFVQQIEKIASSAVKEKCKQKTVALGEVTGHSHLLRPVIGVVEFFTDNGATLCQVEQEAELVHEEHKPIVLKKGKYKVFQQREFDIVTGVRTVMD